jgi:hypothetical protein
VDTSNDRVLLGLVVEAFNSSWTAVFGQRMGENRMEH